MRIYVTRAISGSGIVFLRGKGWEVMVNPVDKTLAKAELAAALRAGGYDAVLCLLTDAIDDEVLEAAGPQCKIFANYAVGFNNIDVAAAAKRNIIVSNTPDVLSASVAEHAFALVLALAHRVAEGDRFVRAGKFTGWESMLLLGTDIAGKTLGIVGLGAIGSRVATIAVRGFGMKVVYNDPHPPPDFERERETGAAYCASADDVFRMADFISLHVPLLPSTSHLVGEPQLNMMKKTAFLINTSRGPVVDEAALVRALQGGVIAGAALDVFEREPELAPGLAELDNVILTPHIASATRETREAMSLLAAQNIAEALEGRTPPNAVHA
jgi:glyoxylate reductase